MNQDCGKDNGIRFYSVPFKDVHSVTVAAEESRSCHTDISSPQPPALTVTQNDIHSDVISESLCMCLKEGL